MLRIFVAALSLIATPALAADYSGLIGKYPHEVFPNNPQLKQSIKKLVGKRDAALFEDLGVETPFEREGKWVVTTFCMPHNCGAVQMTVAIPPSGKMIAAVLNDGDVSFHGDAGGASLPPSILGTMAN